MSFSRVGKSMLKRLKTVRRKRDKEPKSGSAKLPRRSNSIAEIEFEQSRETKKSHKRTKSSQSCQTDFAVEPASKITINQKQSEEVTSQTEPKSTPQLHPAYLAGLLILIGFNFAAFTVHFANSTIAVYRMVLAVVFGVMVAQFLRKFIGLNLFKTQDKVSERAVLTIVTQIRLVYKFIMSEYDDDMGEFTWSFFLFNLSIWILFLDKVSTGPLRCLVDKVPLKQIRLPKLH